MSIARRYPRQIGRVRAQIKQSGAIRRVVNLAIHPIVIGKIDAFVEPRVSQTEMSHPSGAEPVFGFSGLG